MLCAKFGGNWPSGSGEEDSKFHHFSLFGYYLPLEKGMSLHLNKLEFPSSKDALCQVWLKLAQRFWRRKVYDNNDDDGQILIRKAHLSHPSAHVS